MEKEQIIQYILQTYNEKSRFLQSFHLEEEKKGFALFKISSEFYCPKDQPAEYLTAVELQVCLNQLLYAYFSQLGLFDFILRKENCYESLIKSIINDCYVVGQNFKFKKKIAVKELLHANILIKKAKKIRDTSFMLCQFNFENFCYGEITVVLKSEDNNTFHKITKLVAP